MAHQKYETFPIKNRKDIRSMQSTMCAEGFPEDKRYIALELAENMVSAKGKGRILVNGVEVVNVVEKGINEEKVGELYHYLQKARDMLKTNKHGKVKPDPSRKLGGRGFLTMLSAGWNINVSQEKNSKELLIVATRKAN